MGQLAEIGVKPGDIAFVAVSHTHPDHIGNVDRFPASLLLIQKKAQFDWAFAPGKRPLFKNDRPLKLLEGDYDVFGGDSVILLSTPGHTPGHQALLVHLAKSGWILLAGDAAHFQDNWDNDRVPSINTSAEQTHASHTRLVKILAEKKRTALDQPRPAELREPEAFAAISRLRRRGSPNANAFEAKGRLESGQLKLNLKMMNGPIRLPRPESGRDGGVSEQGRMSAWVEVV